VCLADAAKCCFMCAVSRKFCLDQKKVEYQLEVNFALKYDLRKGFVAFEALELDIIFAPVLLQFVVFQVVSRPGRRV
jgi:hypothetical protein